MHHDGIDVAPAYPHQAAVLTDLALRSKAAHGYDAAFMQACREELTVRRTAISDGWVQVAKYGERIVGLFQFSVVDGVADVDLFFVDPSVHRQGVGRSLWLGLERKALTRGASRIRIESDPEAVAFYQAMGARIVGRAPSGSIPGRSLPLLEKPLAP